MTLSYFAYLYMFNLVGAAMKLSENPPGAREGIHNFGNATALFIRLHRELDKDHIPNGVKTLVRAAGVDIFAVIGAVGVNEFTRNFAAC